MTGGATEGPLHASAVSYNGAALLILGRSGAGKSALALELVALGAGLVADDLVRLEPAAGGLVVAPLRPGPRQRIEARGLGVLTLPASPPALLRLVLDLDREETERLPPRRVWRHRGLDVTLLLRPPRLSAAALLLALASGGPADPEGSGPLR